MARSQYFLNCGLVLHLLPRCFGFIFLMLHVALVTLFIQGYFVS